MERISPDELNRLILASRDQEVTAILKRAAYTLVEMDKDIAVYEAQIANMQRQFNAICNDDQETR